MILCWKKKAEQGKIYKIFIKDVIVPKQYEYIQIYVDINNSFWNPDDLVTLPVARTLAHNYYESILS